MCLTSSIYQVLVIPLPCSTTSPVLPHNALCPPGASRCMAFLWKAERNKPSRPSSDSCEWFHRVLRSHKTHSNVSLYFQIGPCAYEKWLLRVLLSQKENWTICIWSPSNQQVGALDKLLLTMGQTVSVWALSISGFLLSENIFEGFNGFGEY